MINFYNIKIFLFKLTATIISLVYRPHHQRMEGEMSKTQITDTWKF